MRPNPSLAIAIFLAPLNLFLAMYDLRGLFLLQVPVDRKVP